MGILTNGVDEGFALDFLHPTTLTGLTDSEFHPRSIMVGRRSHEMRVGTLRLKMKSFRNTYLWLLCPASSFSAPVRLRNSTPAWPSGMWSLSGVGYQCLSRKMKTAAMGRGRPLNATTRQVTHFARRRARSYINIRDE